jgi:hypothetical protein
MSVFKDAPFAEHTLTYQVGGAQTGTDEYGNPVFGSSTGTLKVLMAPDHQAQLQRQPGADARLIVMKGELKAPLAFPAGVGLGTVFSVSYAGKPGKLTLTAIKENDLIGVPFGAGFSGDWVQDG